MWANHDGAIFLNVGSSTVTISNYDFTLAPPITWDGTGAVIFNDCTFPQTAAFLGNALASPCNINGTINTTPGSTLTTTCNYCTYNQGVFFAGSGTWANDHCLGTNLNQQWGGASAATITNTWCYVPGLGVAPPTSGTIHIEAIQFNANSPATMTWQSCLVNVAAEGQPNVGSGQSNYGWTAIVTSPVGTGVVLYQNCIFIGLTEMNASTVGNNHIPYFITYGQVTPVTITNCILESGVFGYTSNGDGGANRPVDGGGNRTFTNAALTSASSGWN
ncbi:MAG TPA: hypothetical protein VNW53_14115 [Phenylobacterium sp.]|nr:hypothetical protein [Phenylobacterium sp.]